MTFNWFERSISLIGIEKGSELYPKAAVQNSGQLTKVRSRDASWVKTAIQAVKP